MCPACIATAALIAAGTTTTGGLTTLAVKKLRARNDAKTIDPQPKSQPKRKEESS